MGISVLLVLFIFITGLVLAYVLLPDILDFVIEKSQSKGFYNGSWKTHLGVGRKETSRIEKAAIARVGLGGNSSDETIYWNAFTDSNGDDLETNSEYEIVINSEIPVDYQNFGFWSITIYGEDKFLFENPEKKYLIRDIDVANQSYPIKVTLSKKEGLSSVSSIPLSLKKQKFSIALRCYRPVDNMKQESSCLQINLPQIIKIG